MHGAKRRMLLGILGIAGSLLFGFFLALTYHTPEWLEVAAKDFIESETRRRVDSTIDGFTFPEGEGALSALATSLLKKNEESVAQVRENLKNKVHLQIAASIAEIRDLSCECRKKWETFLEAQSEARLDALTIVGDKLNDLVHGKYMYVLAELRRDVRIFTGANTVAFLLLFFVALLKPKAVIHIFVPGILLFVSVVVCSYFYIFEQNWLFTIIYSDYTGFAYLGYLGLAYAALCDIILNAGRITTEVLNGILGALGSAFTVVPC